MRFRTHDEKYMDRLSLRWHRWFAWHPVTVDGALVWLETVERHAAKVDVYDDMGSAWAYGWKYRRATGATDAKA
jgi:hypothetical protein